MTNYRKAYTMGGYDPSEELDELKAVESAEVEADKENENEHAEAGLPFYKLSK